MSAGANVGLQAKLLTYPLAAEAFLQNRQQPSLHFNCSGMQYFALDLLTRSGLPNYRLAMPPSSDGGVER